MLCKYPFFNKTVGGLVSCRKCLPCRIKKRRELTLRIMCEARLHEHNIWFSLTYSDLYLPRFAVYDGLTFENVHDPKFSTLDRDALELFLKRLRDKFPPRSVRFFACGEYGDDNFRPHYHVIAFGVRPDQFSLVERAWTDRSTGLRMGIARLDAPYINFTNAAYTCGYTVKKMTSVKDERLGGRYPEFCSSSKGIGKNAVSFLAHALQTQSGQQYFSQFKDVPRRVVFDGKSFPLDRYMRENILKELSIYDPAKEFSKQRFSDSMSLLHTRALCNPAFAASIGGPTATTLALQHDQELSQQVLLTERKYELFHKRRNL